MMKSKKTVPQLAPLSVLRMLWKQRFVILLGWIVLTAAGALIIHYLPSVYGAEALILVDPQKIPERFVASTVQVSPQDQLATIQQQILSSGKLQKIIDEFNLYQEERKVKTPEEVITLMRKHVQITPDKGWTGIRPSAFRISYEGRNPTVVASVVNRIAGLFIDESLKTREERAVGTSEFLDNQLQEARKTLENQESILRQFKIKRMGELPEQQTALIGTLGRLQAELQSNQDAANRADQNRVMLENTLRQAENSQAALARSINEARTAAAPPVTISPSGQVVARVVRPSEELRAKLEQLRLGYSEDHPDVKRAKASLDLALRRERAEEVASEEVAKRTPKAPAQEPVKAAKTDNPQLLMELNREREQIATIKTQLSFANRELEARRAERQRIVTALADYQSKVERLPLREQELASITRDYEMSKQNYRSLLEKKMSAETATEMERQQQSERFTLLEPAKVPLKPVKPNRLLFFAGAVVLAFGMAIGLGVAIEVPKNRFLGEWELPPDTKVIGCISAIRLTTAKQTRSVAGVVALVASLAGVFGGKGLA